MFYGLFKIQNLFLVGNNIWSKGYIFSGKIIPPAFKLLFFVPTYQDSQDVFFFYGKTGKINNQEEHLLDFCVISMKSGKEKNINIKVHLKFFSHQIVENNFFGNQLHLFYP